MAAIAEIVQGGVQGGADIGFGIYDRYMQEQREKDRQDQIQQQLNELTGVGTGNNVTASQMQDSKAESSESDDIATEE